MVVKKINNSNAVACVKTAKHSGLKCGFILCGGWYISFHVMVLLVKYDNHRRVTCRRYVKG